ncbi:VOC family protein [bacterium]|jgi:catechol 2,3-dioxygenase-like lactoylglutathione lyase family enzyme|nr:VOC family protein [bacterium]
MISNLDHLVLTVKDIPRTVSFYTTVLKMKEITFGDNRKALTFGSQKINLHQKGDEFSPHAKAPTEGSSDLCFIAKDSLEEVIFELQKNNVEIIEGPVERTGAMFKLLSVYFRDPDGNLIEVSSKK